MPYQSDTPRSPTRTNQTRRISRHALDALRAANEQKKSNDASKVKNTRGAHASPARAAPARAAPTRSRATRGGRQGPPIERAARKWLLGRDVSPPSLPYKVDTSRPSLRTDWTRLARQRKTNADLMAARTVSSGAGAAAEPRGSAASRQRRTVPASPLGGRAEDSSPLGLPSSPLHLALPHPASKRQV